MNNKIPKLEEITKALIKRIERYKFVLIVVAAGLILLILPSSDNKESEKTENTESTTADEFSLEEIEEKIAEAISNIEGAGRVQLVLTLKSGTEYVLAEDEDVSYNKDGKEDDTEYAMDESKNTVTISKGSGNEEAIVIKRIYPEFQGALIICDGADSALVNLKIIESVSALTGLGADKVKVIKMKS